jgi:PKD repeat protein
VTDDDGGSDSKSIEVTVVEPVVFAVDAGSDAVIDEGSLFVSAGSFVGSVGDVFTGMVDYGDGSGSQPLALNPDYTFGLSHLYVENGLYTVSVTVFKESGASASDSALVTVNNVPPIATLMNDGPKDEGSPAMISFTDQYDPGIFDTFTYSFDWNNDGVYEISNQAGASMIYTWYDEGMYTVKGKIQDDDGGFTEYTTVVTILNVPPTITLLSGPVDPVLLGNSITLNGVFIDPGILDGHVALISWGDGLSTNMNLASGVYQVSGSHTYRGVGVYIITLTVTDDDGGSDTKSIESYVVIYTPNGGFITGGGWLISPQGSYPANPALSGRVNFGFVSKYKKGQIVPEGETEFQFQLAGINFHSHVQEWLIIVGAKATYLGEGTINGQGHYGFRLTAIDGKISGGGGVDKLRMKIWDKDNNDQIVYDTDYGAPDSQNPSVALSGGQITIHKA